MDGRDSDPKIAQIRAAGKQLFLRHGFDRTSTAALAKAAGVSKETLYSRYSNKEAIFVDVLEQLIPTDEIASAVPPVLRTRADLERALAHLIRGARHYMIERQYVELARIVIAETPRLPRLGQIFRQTVPIRLLQSAETLLDTAVEAGLIGDVDRLAAARIMFGPVLVEVVLNGLLVAEDDAGAERENGDDHDQDHDHIALLMSALAAPEIGGHR